jgi:hypothetical protein
MAAAGTVKSDLPAYTYQEERDADFVDELIRVSEDKRTEMLGPNYWECVKEFYLFRPSFWQPQLEYQIKLRTPELQTLFIQEASDLTDNEPVFFVSRDGQRSQDREDAFQANWRANHFQNELFAGTLWSMLCHTGFMEIIADGKDRGVRIRARNPQNVYPDPFATDWREWEYLILRVPMSPDEIVRTFPWAENRLPGMLMEHEREMYLRSRVGGVVGSGPDTVELPPGAMQTVPIGRPPGAQDFLAVDYIFIRDESREDVVKQLSGSKNAGGVLPPPKTIPKYPTGRMMVRTGKLKLWDGQNQYRRFPIIPIFSQPPLYGVWGTPPIQYFVQMQHLAESMISQTAENAIRLNYGYRLYADGMILNPENMDKLGGMLRVKTADDVSKAFRIISPQPYTQEQTLLPEKIQQRMRELFGYNDQRQGKTGAGNISPTLFAEGVNQGQGITRARSRMLAEAVEYIGQLVFETMVDYVDDTVFSESVNGDFRLAPWQGVPLDQLNGWKVQLDAASLKPMAKASLRQMAMVLANLGKITDKYLLKWLDVPHADDIAADLDKQRMMQAMAAMAQQGQKGKK